MINFNHKFTPIYITTVFLTQRHSKQSIINCRELKSTAWQKTLPDFIAGDL